MKVCRSSNQPILWIPTIFRDKSQKKLECKSISSQKIHVQFQFLGKFSIEQKSSINLAITLTDLIFDPYVLCFLESTSNFLWFDMQHAYVFRKLIFSHILGSWKYGYRFGLSNGAFWDALKRCCIQNVIFRFGLQVFSNIWTFLIAVFLF